MGGRRVPAPVSWELALRIAHPHKSFLPARPTSRAVRGPRLKGGMLIVRSAVCGRAPEPGGV